MQKQSSIILDTKSQFDSANADVVDSAGQQSKASAKQSSAPDLTNASDTGESNTDNLTGINTPTLVGTAEANTTVTLYDDHHKVVVGTAVTDATGHWSITTTPLADGEHKLTVKVKNTTDNGPDPDGSNGNGTQGPKTITIVIDTVAPVAPGPADLTAASDSGRSNVDDITYFTKPTFTGIAPAGVTVTLYDGSIKLGSGVANRDGIWTITAISDMAQGVHDVVATTVDAAGNMARATGLLVTIDTEVPPPELPDLLPQSDSGRADNDNITNITAPLLSGKAEAIAIVNVYDGQRLLGTTMADAAGNWSIISPALPDGVHDITATATDVAGNVSARSAVLAVTVDTVPPPAPVELDLIAPSDSGISDHDDVTKVATPVITGKAEAYAIVKLFDGQNLVGTALADAAGAWTITTTTLADGVHTFSATATDVAGNVSPPSRLLPVTVDTVAPAIVTLDLATPSDSGRSGSDDITNINTPVIIGKAEAGSTVSLYDGVTKIGTALTDAAGVWTVTTPLLVDGVHVLTATAADVAGNVSQPSAPLPVTIDTVPPLAPVDLDLTTPSDSGISDSDDITNINKPVITGKAEANAIVDLYEGDIKIGTALADSSGVWTITTTTLLDGIHKLAATATDVAGNVSPRSALLAITIDTVPPAAPADLDLAAPSDSGSSDSDNITNATTPVITGKAEPGSTVNLYDGQAKVGTTVADASGAWTITTSILSNGIHHLTATATDVAGNVSPPSPLLPLTVDVMAPLPPVTLDLATPSDSGRSISDDITNINTPVITGSAEAGSTVHLYDGAAKIGTAIADNAGAWTVTTTLLQGGIHHLTATATDAAGNVSPPSAPLAVTIDTVPPPAPVGLDMTAASDSGSSNSDNLTKVTTPVITGSAEAGSIVILYEGTVQVGTALTSGEGIWSITTATLANGVHQLSATATDVAGNVSAPSEPLAVTIDTSPPSQHHAPSLDPASDDGVSNTDNVTGNPTPTVVCHTEPGAIVTLYDGNTVVGTTIADAQGQWSITTTPLLAGTHSLISTSTDAAGNVSAPSAALAIRYEPRPAAPSTPAFAAGSDNGASSSDNLTSIATPTFTGTAPVGTTVTLYDGATACGTGTTDSNGQWSITCSPLSQGGHSLTATATNAGGYTSDPSGALGCSIDFTAPSAPSSGGAAPDSDTGASSTDNITSDTTPTWTGNAEPGTVVNVYEGNTLLGSGTAGANGGWSITSSPLNDGTHVLTVTATDPAGNVSTPGNLPPLTVDTSIVTPSAPTLAPGSDTGLSDTDNITSITTPSFTGSAEPGSTVTLYSGSTILGTAVAIGSGGGGGGSGGDGGGGGGGGGSWTINVSSAIVIGTHFLTVVTTDLAGNSSQSDIGEVVIGLAPVAPSAPDLAAVSDSGVSNTDNITSVTTPVFNGTAIAGASVTLYEGQAVRGSGIADAAGAWSIMANGVLAEGVHSLAALVTNNVGMSALSPALSVTVDSTAPAAPSAPDLAAASDNGSSNSDNATTITTPVLTGSAEAGATVTLYEGATVRGTGVANASGAWSITSSALAIGAHPLTATASDAAGNVSAASTGLTVVVANLPTAPSVPDLAAETDSGASNTDNLTNITQPVLTGTAEAGATVTLLEGATVRGTGVADGAGAWAITPNSALAQGAHLLKASATNLIGTSAVSGTVSVTIDTTAPATPAAPDLTTDSGSSSVDNITNAGRPSFSGTTEANAIVTLLYPDGYHLASATANGTGAWTLTSSLLPDGPHGLTVIATDRAGNQSAVSAPLAVTIDTSVDAPSAPDLAAASDTGTSNNDDITTVTAPVFTGTAEAGVAVQLREGSKVLGNATASAAGAWSITSSALAFGTHNVSAVVTDKAGNVSAPSDPLQIVVAQTPAAPGVPDLAAVSDSGVSNTDNLTNITQPVLTGTADAGAIITLLEGATVRGTSVANGAGEWAITANAALAQGAHALSVRYTNVIGTSAASAALSVTIDTTAPARPAAPDLTSDSGSSGVDNITNVGRPSFSGTTEANAIVTLLYPDGSHLASATANGTGAWTLTSSLLPDGPTALTVISTDRAGNQSAASAPLAVTIDTTVDAPSAPDLAAASDTGTSNNDDLTTVTTPVFTGTAEAGVVVQLREGSKVLGNATANAVGAWSITSSVLALGIHNVSAVVTDKAGNVSAPSGALQIVVGALPAAPSAPNMTDDSDSGTSTTDNRTNITTPTLTGTAAVGTTVNLFDGAINVGSTVVDGAGNWAITTTPLSQATHNLTVRATNDIGTSAASAALSVTIDTSTVTPSAPDLAATSDNGFISSDNITTLHTLTLTGTGEVGATVALMEWDKQWGSAAVNGAGSWSITASGMDDGAHNLAAVATDLAGNVSTPSAALVVTIDNTAPAAPSAPDLVATSDRGTSNTDNLTNDTTPDFTGTAEPGSRVELFLENGNTISGGQTTTNASGVWYFSAISMASGVHRVVAVVTDAAGNVSGTSAVLELTIIGSLARPSLPWLAPGSDYGQSTNDNITGATNIAYTGTAVPGTAITVYQSSNLSIPLANAITDAEGVWTTQLTNLGIDKQYQVVAVARDAAGNTSPASSSYVFTVDSVAPTVMGVRLNSSTSDTGRSNADGITNLTTVDLIATNGPNNAGIKDSGATFSYYDNGVYLGTSVPYRFSLADTLTVTLSPGAHSLTVVQTDVAGNSSPMSAPFNVLIDIDAPATAFALDLVASSDNGSSNTDNITSMTNLLLTGNAEPLSTLKFYDNGTLLSGSNTNSSGIWTFGTPSLAVGVHSITVMAIDMAGNMAPMSDPLVITVVAPTTSHANLPELGGTAGMISGSSASLGHGIAAILVGQASIGIESALYLA